MLLVVGCAATCFADLENSMSDLQDKIRAISTPIAIVLLMVAAWQLKMGNKQLLTFALIGTTILFGAPQIVELIQSVFGG